jgi:DNA polymerase I-like protein with 3'-5' exonuclease and polymerase domains
MTDQTELDEYEQILTAFDNTPEVAPADPTAAAKDDAISEVEPETLPEIDPETLLDEDESLEAVRVTEAITPELPNSEEDGDIEALLATASFEQVLKAPSFDTDLGDDDVSLEEFQSTNAIQQQSTVPRISKPWMKHHKFVLVQKPDEVDAIVDEAIADGHCSLDLETEGFDNRINYDESGKPHTVHQIVGFCIAYGDAKTGYYIPIRHRPMDGGDDLNVKPVERVEAAIKRLCEASQPTPKPDAKEPLNFSEYETPPKVVLEFWNAKFDQEFLYPITGIDYWHPDSFEDGLLASFVLYTDDKHLGLKNKSKEKLVDPDNNHYEMIEMKDLFLRGRPVRFYELAPDEEGTLNYACSDAVCTRLLCAHPDIVAKVKANPRWRMTYRLEKQVAQVVRTMERNRVKVDRSQIAKMLEENELERDALRDKIVTLALSKGWEKFEPSSPKQLGDFLFDKKWLNLEPKPPRTEKAQQFKTDADTLEALITSMTHPPDILKWVLAFRGCEKLSGTYLESLNANPDANDELRFDFKQTGTQTARFTAPARDVDQGFSGIPIHGMPKTKKFRRLFISRTGYTMGKFDYAGQELRIAANESGETVWINEFLHGTGDLHTITARAFFGKQIVSEDERGKAKCVHPSTLIATLTGWATIQSLGDFPKDDGTFKCIVDDGVMLCDGARVESLYNGGMKPLVHVVSSNGALTCTEEHQFQLQDGTFVRAGDLKEGAVLADSDFIPIEDNTGKPLPCTKEQAPDLAYDAGVFTGGGPVDWSAASKLKIPMDHRVPQWVISAGKETVLHYLGGLFDTEGRVNEDDHCLSWLTEDFVLAGQIACVLRACVLSFDLELPFARPKTDYVRLVLTSKSSWALRDYLRKESRVTFLQDNQYPDRLPNPVKVLKVIPAGIDQCLDIMTSTAKHIYQANGYLTHNTANFALLYGGGPGTIVQATGCTQTEGIQRKEAFDKAVPTFAKWVKGQKARVKKDLGVWNAFGRWLAIPDANIKAGGKTSRDKIVSFEEAQAIRSACERHSCNYPIQSGGADTMKISMVVLYREFYKRGWLRNSGNDSVRMLLTIHDELVFEIRHDLVQEAITVITDGMAFPGKIPKNPVWRVPLIVEPLLGLSWGGEYDYGMIKHGKVQAVQLNEKLKDHELRIGDRIYHKVPPWLEGIILPGYTVPEDTGGSGTPGNDQGPVVAIPKKTTEEPSEEPSEVMLDTSLRTALESVSESSPIEAPPEVPNAVVAPLEPLPVTPAQIPVAPAVPTMKPNGKHKVFTFCILEGCMNDRGVRDVFKTLVAYLPRTNQDSTVFVRILDPWKQTIFESSPTNLPALQLDITQVPNAIEELRLDRLTDGKYDLLDS